MAICGISPWCAIEVAPEPPGIAELGEDPLLEHAGEKYCSYRSTQRCGQERIGEFSLTLVEEMTRPYPRDRLGTGLCRCDQSRIPLRRAAFSVCRQPKLGSRLPSSRLATA